MSSTLLNPSVRDLPPLESGGVHARDGFVFQDHVAVAFCLEMVTKSDLREVWCETQDDITLIQVVDQHEEVEFIQAKDIDHLWTVAKLCKREKPTSGSSRAATSILEKSLKHDRCRESCRFRIVTSREVHKDLELLKLPLTSPSRSHPNVDFDELSARVCSYVAEFRSQNGHDYSFWLRNTVWQVEHSDEAVKRKNIEVLTTYVEEAGYHLPLSLVKDRVYPRLLQRAQDAAKAKWEIDPEAKKIRRDEFISWLEKIVREAQYPALAGAGEKMQEKMERASIPSDYIETAHEERRCYRAELLTARYLDCSDHTLIQGEVLAELTRLLSRLDTDEVPEGLAFYKTCLGKMKELQASLDTRPQPPLFFLDGCMHDIVDRCAHRYRRLLR